MKSYGLLHQLKTFFFFILDYIVCLDIRLFLSTKSKNKSLCIIRLDRIGDYILFRNFLSSIKSSSLYKDYSITLIGNLLWQSIAQTFDHDDIHDFIWIDRSKFERSLWYRIQTLRHLSTKQFDIVYQPTFSRLFHFGDAFVRAIRAPQKIGCDTSDFDLISSFQKKISNTYYTKVITPSPSITFEFLKNKYITECFLNTSLSINKPTLNTTMLQQVSSLPRSYITICPGSGASFRCWDIENYIKLIHIIQTEYNINIVLIGSKSEQNIGHQLCQSSLSKMYNYIGKISLSESVSILASSRLIICHDSAPVHIAYALSKPFICLSNGNHYGRFIPHQNKTNQNQYYVFPEKFNSYTKNKKMTHYSGSNLDIDDISVNDIYHLIQSIDHLKSFSKL